MTQVERKTTGTTTLGVTFNGGVVLASERKATLGYLVDSVKTKKVFKIDNRIGMTIAGSVGDVQTIIRYMRAEAKLYALQKGAPIPVRAAATLLSTILQGSRYYPYMGQFIIGGVDERGPQVFSLDPVGGVEDSEDYYATGSGMPIALGVMEDKYKRGMTKDEAIKLTIRAISSAKKRDIASGGEGFNVALIDAAGYRDLTEKEIEAYLKG